MKPLEYLSAPEASPGQEPSPIERLLREAPTADVARELERLAGQAPVGAAAAALSYGRGALALREGRLDAACDAFAEAERGFGDAGQSEAAALSSCERWLSAIRRGPRKIYGEAAEALAALALSTSARVKVVATHYRATALRYAGQAEATLHVLLEAFAASEDLLAERAQVLNSLGTLYVVLGAYGAAETVLSHAAELNHMVGDRVSEAISYGQLGSAAMARGELEAARRYLQRQEWFASRVDDAFGQARALVLLGDLAIDAGRADEAIELCGKARQIASSVTPPLGMWVAYATRTIGRAKVELGDEGARDDLEAAQASFRAIGNQLGDALVGWDMARLAGRSGVGESSGDGWHTTAWAFAALGLSARVAQVLQDLRSLADDPAQARCLDLAIAATGQAYPHLSTSQEVELVLSQPDTVSVIATRRIGGQRNLGRLAACTLARGGLHVGVVAAAAIGTGLRALPTPRSEATLLGQLPGVAVWAWRPAVSLSLVARDLSALRVALGEDTRAVLGWFPDARVASVPFAGELGVEVVGVDLGSYVASAIAAAPAKLCVLPGADWDREADAIARMSGFSPEVAG